MTAQEIQTLIDSTIKGQGTNIDGGGQLANILSGILELATAPAPEPETHILEIGSLSDGLESESDALARLSLDAKAVSLNDLVSLDIKNTIIFYDDTNRNKYYNITYKGYVDQAVTIVAGYESSQDDSADTIVIIIDGEYSSVKNISI